MAMSEDEVAEWLRSRGVADNVIKDEAKYISTQYGDADEDPEKVLQGSLGGYLQRTASGRDYNTDNDDPEVKTEWGTTKARSDSPLGLPGAKTSPGTVSSTAENWNTSTSAATGETGTTGQAQTGQVQSALPDWYRDIAERQMAAQEADRAERDRIAAEDRAKVAEEQRVAKERADTLYGQLDARATQGLSVNADDPVIKAQTNAFAAAQERARRNYLSDTAERGGPYINMTGQRRIAAERAGVNNATFGADLLAREYTAKRAEIADALRTQGSILSQDQQRALTAKLANYDTLIEEAQVSTANRGLGIQEGLGFSDLALRQRLGTGDLDLRRELGMGDLDLRRELGVSGLDLQRRGQDMDMDQYLRTLGFQDWDRSMYYDLVQRGAI